MSESIIIVEHNRSLLMELVVAFRGTPYSVTAVEHTEPLATATRLTERRPAAMVVALDGRENVADVRAFLDAAQGIRVLFIAPRMPTSPALARIVREACGAVLAAREPPIVVVATLIGMLTRERGAVS